MQAINTLGVLTLCKREIWRFAKVWNQTIVAPMVTTLLFLAILTLAMGGAHAREIDGVPYGQFIAPGLVMMAVVQNAFANTSSSLTIAKIQGVIIDVLMPPFKGWELVLSYTVGGMARGLCVFVSVTIAVYCFIPFTLHSAALMLFYILASSMMLALIGLLTGIWAQTFDQVSAVTNYVITPFAFLSGTFYSIKQLPPLWYQLCHINPFFYMIDGFRYSITGYTDGHIVTGMLVLIGTNLALWAAAQWMFTKGYRLKS